MSTPVVHLRNSRPHSCSPWGRASSSRGDSIGSANGSASRRRLLGMVTALGADAPEIASAVAAVIAAGHEETGVGVVVGSNVFNLAALLGVSALIAGRVSIHGHGLVLNGGVAIVIAIIGALVALDLLPDVIGLTLAVVELAALCPSSLRCMNAVRSRLPAPLREAVAERAGRARRDESGPAGDSGSTPSPSLRLSAVCGRCLWDGRPRRNRSAIALNVSDSRGARSTCAGCLDDRTHCCGSACAPRPRRCVCERGSQLEQREHPGWALRARGDSSVWARPRGSGPLPRCGCVGMTVVRSSRLVSAAASPGVKAARSWRCTSRLAVVVATAG